MTINDIHNRELTDWLTQDLFASDNVLKQLTEERRNILDHGGARVTGLKNCTLEDIDFLIHCRKADIIRYFSERS